MATLKNYSRQDFESSGTVDHINAGSFQRIADACELMAKNHAELIRERDSYKRWYQDGQNELTILRKKVSCLRGVITRMKKQQNPEGVNV